MSNHPTIQTSYSARYMLLSERCYPKLISQNAMRNLLWWSSNTLNFLPFHSITFNRSWVFICLFVLYTFSASIITDMTAQAIIYGSTQISCPFLNPTVDILKSRTAWGTRLSVFVRWPIIEPLHTYGTVGLITTKLGPAWPLKYVTNFAIFLLH